MNIIKYKSWFFGLSLLVLAWGGFGLIRFGLRPAIDFTGGSLLEVQLPDFSSDIKIDDLQPLAKDIYEITAVQNSGAQTWILRGKPLANDSKNQVLINLKSQFGQVIELRFETVGPTLGTETLKKMLLAIIIVSSVITLYVWHQFHELKYGVCAILAMFHDSMVLIGSFSWLGHWWGMEVDVLLVTAVLTTLTFSVHDTIVVYDRIRELRRYHPRQPFANIVNAATWQTLGRSLNNSLTIIIMLLSLTLLGGQTIRWFATALLIGSVTGTYSSTFTAVPLLVLWDELKIKIRRIQTKNTKSIKYEG